MYPRGRDMILLEREKLLSELEQKIGYSFRSRALLDRALTHRSFANERVAEKYQHNEALEFLGDSVLGMVVSAWLLELFPDQSEGKLSKMKAHLVSESSLVELAEEIDLGRYILLNRGEEKTGGRQKRALLADTYEALIGVLYIDGGISMAQSFLRRELRAKVAMIDPTSMIGTDYKSALQERLQATGASVPEYVVVETLGPDHRRTFRVELRVAHRALAMGEGRTIKLAQQEAARAALAEYDIFIEAAEQQSGEAFAENLNGNGQDIAPAVAHAFDGNRLSTGLGAAAASSNASMLMLDGNASSPQDESGALSVDTEEESEAHGAVSSDV